MLKTLSETDVAAYKWDGIGLDWISLGGVKYGAAYATNTELILGD